MKLWTLGSGSKGNALVLECGGSRVIIDAGFPARVLAGRLASLGIAPKSIEACILTHEHGDHVCGAKVSAARWGWSLHATAGTVRGCPTLHDAGVRTFTAGATIELGGFEVLPVETSHDAEEPVALVVTSRRTGVRVGICYDLGFVTDTVRSSFQDLDMLVLEANHDEGMLRSGPYPRSVQQRIASRHGHLSNRAAGAMARDCIGPNLNHLVLAHLSENCNDQRTAMTTVGSALERTRYRGAVHAAPQHGVAGPFMPKLARTPLAFQLGLGL